MQRWRKWCVFSIEILVFSAKELAKKKLFVLNKERETPIYRGDDKFEILQSLVIIGLLKDC